MAYTFDAHSFEQLLGDVECLVASAREHEQRMTALVTLAEDDGQPVLASAAGANAPAAFSPLADLLSTLRDACVAAREQRQLADTILARLVGELAHVDMAHRAPARALVVDDSPDNRELAAAVLEASGFQAITASNGLEAVIVAHYARPAVVLMDVTMPVLDGIGAARLLKASAVTRHLKVIAYTGKPDAYDGNLTSLFVDVLPKPASPDTIVAAVRRFVAIGDR